MFLLALLYGVLLLKYAKNPPPVEPCGSRIGFPTRRDQRPDDGVFMLIASFCHAHSESMSLGSLLNCDFTVP